MVSAGCQIMVLPLFIMQNRLDKINSWLIKYLYRTGDDQETLVLKKIWWLSHIGGLPLLLLMAAVIGSNEGPGIVLINFIFVFALLLSLLIFHIYRRGIEGFALASQMGLVLLSSVKVYMLGGLLYAGGAIFIGLMGPLYALTLPSRKRAVLIFLMYMVLMIGATLLQQDNTHSYLFYYYVLGFTIGITMAFISLYYYTGQVEILKLEEQKRLEEVDEFKSKFYTHITHEFRTPLTIILGMAEQIKNKSGAKLNEGLNMISRNGRKLLNLTNQMRDLSKLEANAMPVHLIQGDIVLYLKYLAESFHSLASAKNIRILYWAVQEEIMMDFDPDKIQDILSNLLSNAIKFTPEGGRVDVVASQEQKINGNQLKITVKDTGQGIPARLIPKVFDRYFQASNQIEQLAEGSGLGLALTKELVKLLKGEIRVESSLNEGTAFTVGLPITNRAKNGKMLLSPELTKSGLRTATADLTASTTGNDLDEKLTLLIVEDNEDVIQYMYTLLSGDYRMVTAANGQQGLEKAIEYIPDLVISDVMMPVMDGYTFCDRLKSDLRTSHIPVVLLTARADMESKMQGLESGADVYLAKPFNPEELHLRIVKLIELRKALQDRYKAIKTRADLTIIKGTPILDKEDEFIKKVRQTLEFHLSEEEFGITELCSSLAMSRSQLYRKFTALTNTTVHRFILRLRLAKARELLLTTSLNVAEVAYDTGFKNPSHFSRVYSEEYGLAPSKSRTRSENLL